MKKLLCLCLLAGFLLAAVTVTQEAEARPPCPPGYFWDGPNGCMPIPYAPPPPPPAYYYPVACPPGTYWQGNACVPVPPPPPPAPGIGIFLPPIQIGR